MFEKLLGKILDEQLGKFFVITNKDISLGVFKGNILLENLSLRPNALQGLNLPVVIKHGHVGKISIKVKWSKLLSEPVNILLENLFVVAGPQTQWEESQEVIRKLEVQRSKLQADEVVRKLKRDAVSGVTAANKDKAKSIPAIAQKIIENIQVFIKNIHICYEDTFTKPDNPFVLGLVLGGLNVQNVERGTGQSQSQGQAWPGKGALPRDLATQHAGKYVAKVAELENFAVYWNADQLFYPVSQLPEAEMVRFLQHRIDLLRMPAVPDSLLMDPRNRFRFMVHPIKMTVDIDIMKVEVPGVPQVSARIDVKDITVSLDASQLEGARGLGEFFGSFEKFHKKRQRRPGRPPVKKFADSAHTRLTDAWQRDNGATAQAWWRYAILSVREAIAEDFKRFSWKRIATRRAVRVEYIQWRTRMLLEEERGNEDAAAACQERCQKVEDLLTVPDVIYYRDIAELEVLRLQKMHARDPLDNIFSLARVDKMNLHQAYQDNVKKPSSNVWHKVRNVLTLGLANKKKRRAQSNGSLGPATSVRSAATHAMVVQQQQQQNERLGTAGSGGSRSVKKKGRRLTYMDRSQREQLLAECENQAQLAAAVERKLRELNADGRMTEDELQEYLQDVIYPEFFLALQQRRAGPTVARAASMSTSVRNIDAEAGTVKVRIQMNLGTAAFMLLMAPRKRLMAKAPAPSSSFLQTADGQQLGSGSFNTNYTASMRAQVEAGPSRGWRRLRAFLGTLLERTPDRDPRHRLCRVEVNRISGSVELRGAKANIAVVHFDIGGAEIRDLTYASHWPVLVTPMKSDRYFETKIDPQEPRIQLDVQSAGGVVSIAIKAHHIKAVYSRFMTTLVYFITPPRPNLKQRILDPKFADVRERLRSTITRPFEELMKLVKTAAKLEVSIEISVLHAVVPVESELDVPATYVLKRKVAGWGDDGIILVACARKCNINVIQADKATRASARVQFRSNVEKDEARLRNEVYDFIGIRGTGVDLFLTRESQWKWGENRRTMECQLLETTDVGFNIVRAVMFKAQTLKMTFDHRVVMRLSLWQFKSLLAVIKSIQTGLKNARNFGINKWMHMVHLIREFKGDQASYQIGLIQAPKGADITVYNKLTEQIGVCVPTFRLDFEGFGRRLEMNVPFADVHLEGFCPGSNAWHSLLEPASLTLEIVKDVSRFDAMNREMTMLRGAKAKFAAEAMPSVLSLARSLANDGATALTGEVIRKSQVIESVRASVMSPRSNFLDEMKALYRKAVDGVVGPSAKEMEARALAAPSPPPQGRGGGSRGRTPVSRRATVLTPDGIEEEEEEEEKEEGEDDFLLQINWTHLRLQAEERAAVTFKFETLEIVKQIQKEWREATREYEWRPPTRQMPTTWTLRNASRDPLGIAYTAPWRTRPETVDFAPVLDGFTLEPTVEVCLPFGPFGAGRGCFSRFDPTFPARRAELLVRAPSDGLVPAGAAPHEHLLPAHRDGTFVFPAHPEAPPGADLVWRGPCPPPPSPPEAAQRGGDDRDGGGRGGGLPPEDRDPLRRLRPQRHLRRVRGASTPLSLLGRRAAQVRIESPEAGEAAGMAVQARGAAGGQAALGQGALTFRLAPGERDSVPARLCPRARLWFRPAAAAPAWPAAPHLDLATRSADPAAAVRWEPAALAWEQCAFALESRPLTGYWALPARAPRLAPVELIIRAPITIENLIPVPICYRISRPPYPVVEGVVQPGDCFDCLYPPPRPDDEEPTLALALDPPDAPEQGYAASPAGISPRLMGLPPPPADELPAHAPGRRLHSAGRTIRESGPAGSPFFATVPHPLARSERRASAYDPRRLRWSAPVPLAPGRLPSDGARLGVPDLGQAPGPDHPVLLVAQECTRERPSDALAPLPPQPKPLPRRLLIAAPLWVVNDTGLPLRVRPGSGKEAEAAVPHVLEAAARVLAPASNTVHVAVGAACSFKPIDVSKKVSAGTCELTDGTVVYELGYTVTLGNGPLEKRTRVLTLSPRIVFVNHVIDRKAEPAVATAVEIVQDPGMDEERRTPAPAVAHPLRLDPGEAKPLWWTELGSATGTGPPCRRVRLALDSPRTELSGPFTVVAPGSFPLRVRKLRAPAQAMNVRVHVYLKGPTLQVHLTEETRDFASARIENACRTHEIAVSQLGSVHSPQQLKPVATAGSATAWYTSFGWDEPLAERRRVRVDVVEGGTPHTVEVDIEREGRVAIAGPMAATVRFDRKGTRVLTVTDHADDEGEDDYFSYRQKLTLDLHLAAASVSIADDGATAAGPRELLYATLDDVTVAVDKWGERQLVDIAARRLQMDAAASGSQFAPLPVLLAPNARKFDVSKPMLAVHLMRTSTTMSATPPSTGALPPIVIGPISAPAPALNINAYNELVVELQPIEVRIDDTTLLALVAWAKGAAARRAGPPASHERALHAIRAAALASQPGIPEPKRFLFGLLRVESGLAIDLTFRASAAGAGAPPGAGLPAAIQSLGAVFANVEGAPIRLNPFGVRQHLGPASGLKKPLVSALAKQAAPQVAAVLGSAGIIGSPVETLGDMWAGIADLVREPIEGARSPDGTLAGGVARGAASFVRHTLLAPVHATSRVASSLSRGVDALMMDDAYAAERAAARGERPEHLGHGLVLGTMSLGRGLAQGITGVVMEPVRGAQEGGAAGFGAGLARGLVGLPGKPLAGLLDLIAFLFEGLVSTSELVQRAAGAQTRHEWARLPRALTADGCAVPYSGLAAEAQWLLLTPGIKLEGRRERLLGSFALSGDRILAVTDARVVCVRRPPPHEGPGAQEAEAAIARGGAPRLRGRPLSRSIPSSLFAAEKRSVSAAFAACNPANTGRGRRSASAPPEGGLPLGAWHVPLESVSRWELFGPAARLAAARAVPAAPAPNVLIRAASLASSLARPAAGEAAGAPLQAGAGGDDLSDDASMVLDPSGLRLWDARRTGPRTAVCAREEDAAAAAACLREALSGYATWTKP